jgi:hypothetical protein
MSASATETAKVACCTGDRIPKDGLCGANSGTIRLMATSKKTLEAMRRAPTNVRFADLLKVCVEHFGNPRQRGTSHAVFKTPWPGDPRVNIQESRGKAKPYQVRQVLLAIDKLKVETEKKPETKDED